MYAVGLRSASVSSIASSKGVLSEYAGFSETLCRYGLRLLTAYSAPPAGKSGEAPPSPSPASLQLLQALSQQSRPVSSELRDSALKSSE